MGWRSERFRVFFCEWANDCGVSLPKMTCNDGPSDAFTPRDTTATHCNPLQHTATHCNTLQHTATHAATLVYHRSNSLHEIPYLMSGSCRFVAVCCSVLQCVASWSHMYGCLPNAHIHRCIPNAWVVPICLGSHLHVDNVSEQHRNRYSWSTTVYTEQNATPKSNKLHI